MLFVAPRTTTFALLACLFTIQVAGAQQTPVQPASPPASASQPPALPPELKKISDQYFAAVKLHSQKKYPEAIEAYKLFIKMATDAKARPEAFIAAYTNIASIYQLQSDKANYVAALRKILEYDPKDSRTDAQLAIVATTDHNYPEALKLANRVLVLKPTPQIASSAHFIKGNIAVSHKDFKTGASEFGMASRLMPSNSLAHFNYGLALAELKRYDDALAELQTSLKLDSSNKRAQEYYDKLKAFVLARPSIQNPNAPAKTEYDAVLKQDPKNFAALLGKARVLVQMNRPLEAISSYIAAVGVMPKSYDAVSELANIYQTGQNYPNAITFYKKAIELAVALKDKNKEAGCLSNLAYCETMEGTSLGDIHQKAEMLSSAEKHAKRSIEISPEDADKIVQLGRVYNAEGRFPDAEAVYRDLVNRHPDTLKYYNLLAGTFQSRLDVPGFVKAWKIYQARHPEDPTSYEYIVDIYNRTRDYKNAITALQALLSKKNLTNSAIASSRVRLGQDYAELRLYNEARAEFKRVLAMNPSVVEEKYRMQETSALEAEQRLALKALAGLAGLEKRSDEAIGYLNDLKRREAALTHNGSQPVEPDVYKSIAILYEQSNRVDLAIEEYQAMSRALPTNPLASEELGRLYESRKQIDLAADSYRKAATLTPKDPIPNLMKISDMYRRNHLMDKAVKQLETMHGSNPKSVEVLTALGEVYQQTSQDEKALATYNAIVAENPNLHWVQDRRATMLVKLKRFAEAEAIYTKEIDTPAGANRQIYEDLFHAYTAEGHPEKCLAFIKPRLEKAPANNNLMAVTYDQYVREQHEAEGQAYISALIERSKPYRRAAQEAYAEILQVHRHNDKSLAIYKSIATEFPKDLLAQINLVNQLDYNGLADEANRIYTEQISRPDLAKDQRKSLKRQLADRYVRQNHLALAEALYRDLYDSNNADFDAAMRLGALVEKRSGDDGLAFYTKLLGIASYPSIVIVDIHNRMGAILEGQKKGAEAIAHYRETLKLDPDNSIATAGLHRLGK